MAQSVFPNNIKTFIDRTDLVSKVKAADINEAYAEIIAIQKMLLDIPISIGTNNNYIITSESGYTSYIENIKITFKANMTNTGAATVNLNNMGPIPLLKGLGVELEPNEIVSDKYITAICSNNTFIVVDSIPMESLITKFANINHTHQYAPVTHEHAPVTHEHINYATTEHEHLNYSPTDHTHIEFENMGSGGGGGISIPIVYSDALPLDHGTPSSGIIDKAAREDHVHQIDTEINPLDIDETSTNSITQLGHTHKITFPEQVLPELASTTQNGLMTKEHFVKVEEILNNNNNNNNGIDNNLRYSLALGGLIY